MGGRNELKFAFRDDRNLVRVSAHETGKSQKMQYSTRIRLKGRQAQSSLAQLTIYELV
jgi:hypothetical protein